jgi:hypothetical protein
LSDVLHSGPNSTNTHPHILPKEFCSQFLDVRLEGGGKHQGLAVFAGRHVSHLDDFTNLRLKAAESTSKSVITKKKCEIK